MRPADRIGERLEALDRACLRRAYSSEAGEGGEARVVCDARSNDYLGLARAAVSRETGAALEGVTSMGAGAARLIAGTTVEHLELEAELAAWLRVDAALLFTSAYSANVGVLSALGERGDTVFSDALNHASIIDGCRLSRAEVVVVPHLDLETLGVALRDRRGAGGQRWVVTESYFGMDGDSPDLRALRALCDEHDAGLVVDEAHALGVFGDEGRGLCAAAGVVPDVVVGGMGKALGIQGGFVAGPRRYVEWFWNRARSFVFSTAPSPLLARAAHGQVVRARRADAARQRLEDLAQRLECLLRAGGVELSAERRGPIFPIVLGDEAAALRASKELQVLGIRVHPIRPPTVPRGTSRLRVVLRADMTDDEVEALGAGLVHVWREQGARARCVADEAVSREHVSEPATPDPVQSSLPGAPSGVVRGAGEPVPPVAGVARSEHAHAGAVRAIDSGAARAAGSGPGRNRGLARARSWIVLGTGTEVGKTYVALSLVRLLGESGGAVAGLKPIETGYGNDPEGRAMSDATRLQAASFHVKHPTPHPLYAFIDPVTPSLAARRMDRKIEPTAIVDWVKNVRPTLGTSPPALVLETAGGVFSPLGPALTNYDLALAFGSAQWVLVAPDRLGVLHDVSSTLRAMTAMGRRPDWLILNAPLSPDASSGTNQQELHEMGVDVPIIELPRGKTDPLRALLAASALAPDPAPDLAPEPAPSR